jgi:hypothetical protein
MGMIEELLTKLRELPTIEEKSKIVDEIEKALANELEDAEKRDKCLENSLILISEQRNLRTDAYTRPITY